MLYIIVLLVLIVVIAPSIWVKMTIKKYANELPELPGTGCEFAQHLVERFALTSVMVEEGAPGQDHYSPTDKCISLSPDNYNGRSISAVAIAAHEVGHAIQYHRKEEITKLRERYTPIAIVVEKVAIGLISICPILITIFKLPHIGALSVGAGLLTLFISVFIQLIVLPMEWDASFNKALPIIQQGNYLDEQHVPAVRKILRAAAMTYVAATLSSLLNVWRWLAILKR